MASKQHSQVSNIMFQKIGIFILLAWLIGESSFSQEEKNMEKSNISSSPATITYKRKTTDQTNSNISVPSSSTAMNTSDGSWNTSQVQKKNTPTDKYEGKLDTILRLGGKKIICNIQKINPTTVSYTKPGQTAQAEMPRKEIEKIIYRNGRKEIFNKPIFSMVDKTQWEAVLITENEADVEGLYKKDVVKANAASGSRSPKAAKQSASIRLQKKAANIGALMVLLTRSEMKGGYGEIPGWELEGIAYSDTPPADTASVNKAIRKMIERNRAKSTGKKKN
jgi:hypothetical protein